MVRRIAVCDDEQESLKQIAVCLGQIQKDTGDELEVFYYRSAHELLEHMPRDVQVVLLDIGMQEAASPLSGIDAAHMLRAEGLDVTLIFITSMVEYALEGYDVHAFAFLCKPLQYAALKRHLTDAFGAIDAKRGIFLSVDTAGGKEAIDLNTLLYAEVFQHETSFVFADGTTTSVIPLAEVEKKVKRHGFFRCHKSYLVNFKQIQRIDPSSVTLGNGAVVPISKYRRKEFLDAYSRFMGVQFL